MRRLIVLLPLMLLSIEPAYACSTAELTEKMRSLGEASKAAFARDPQGADARTAQVVAITARYKDIGKINVIDTMCTEYDELLKVYK
jgi:hypothetical protein